MVKYEDIKGEIVADRCIDKTLKGWLKHFEIVEIPENESITEIRANTSPEYPMHHKEKDMVLHLTIYTVKTKDIKNKAPHSDRKQREYTATTSLENFFSLFRSAAITIKNL